MINAYSLNVSMMQLNSTRCCLTLSALQNKPDTCASCVDPDETAHKEPSHQDLHCLPFSFDFLLTFLFATMGMSKFNYGNVLYINSGWKGLDYFFYIFCGRLPNHHPL